MDKMPFKNCKLMRLTMRLRQLYAPLPFEYPHDMQLKYCTFFQDPSLKLIFHSRMNC